MTRKQKRLGVIAGGLAMLSVALGLILYALANTISFFVTPSEIAEKGILPGQQLRLGGAVELGSVKHEGTTTIFVVTDSIKTLVVKTEDLLPDLFREGQCVIAEGKLSDDGIFLASKILAKHDESYMPPEVASSLKAKGAEHLCEIKT